MKHSINLYLDELKPKREPLGLALLLASWGGAVLMVLLWQLWLASEASATGQRQQLANTQVAQLRQQVELMTLQLQQRQPSVQLTAQQQQLQAEVAVKTRLRSRLKDSEVLKRRNFSQLMQELSDNHHQDLWLKQISLDRETLVLSGYAKRSEAVPSWVQQLQQISRDGRYQFSALELSRDEHQRLNFVLTGG